MKSLLCGCVEDRPCAEHELAQELESLRQPESGINVHDLARIRRAILTVIDDGCQKHWGQPWLLNADDEALANDERMRFCDAIQNYITRELSAKQKAA